MQLFIKFSENSTNIVESVCTNIATIYVQISYSADYLSRQMHPNSNLKNDTDIIISAVTKIELKKETVKSINSLLNLQKSDKYCQKIKIRLENKDKSIV